jgi:hypothetical protein
MLAAHQPASTADAEHRRQQRAEALRKKLARIDVSERALVTELETPVDPADPAAQALRTASAPGSPSYTPTAPPSRPS